MSNERGDTLVVIRALKGPRCYSQMASLMQSVIQIEPKLTEEERQLLLFAYKGLLRERRDELDVIRDRLTKEPYSTTLGVSTPLDELQKTVYAELLKVASELEELIDSRLLPTAQDVSERVFYLRLKADALRYVCGYCEGEDREAIVKRATECYEQAMTEVQESLGPRDPTRLGLMLNYAVFMFEVLDQKVTAVALLEATYEECPKPTDVDIESANETQIRILLQLIMDNITLWRREITDVGK